MHFAVLGCGIIGLTTALELQQVFNNAKVTILADRFNESTTSHVAAGIFRPGANFMGPNKHITQQWITDAYNYWSSIQSSEDAPLAGVCELSAYMFSSISPSIVRNPYMEHLLAEYRPASAKELKLCHGDWKYGSFFTTLLIESNLFLPYATNKFTESGGIIKYHHVDALTQIPGKYDAVINCTGLGAKDLCNDQQLTPLRGQVIKVEAPWIKTAFYGDYDTYIIPGFKTVTLGGCRQFDSYNTSLCKYDSMAIMDRCCSMLPSLRQAPIVQQRVGLRPYRSTVRVESEILHDVNGNAVKVVHNYGHGGYGITTAPGTAKYAVRLVHDLVVANSKL